MYFFDIAVLRYSGDKKFDYLFFDKKRFENRYNVTAIPARLLYANKINNLKGIHVKTIFQRRFMLENCIDNEC